MIELAYTKAGDNGLPVVFMHGFCENKSIWNDFKLSLSNQHTVYCIDLPGFGNSRILDVEPKMEAYAKAVFDTIHKLGINRAVFVGHSLGGYVALCLARLYPQAVLGMCLFHSTCYADSETKKENRNKVIDFVKENGSKAFAKTLFPTLFLEANLSKHQTWLEKAIQEAAKISTQAIIDATIAMRDRSDETNTFAEANFPSFFIAGKQDKAVPLTDSIAQAHLPPQAHSLIIQDCAHMGMIEQKRNDS